MGRLDGKVAIITGSARGTGEATARLFVEEGARVLLGDVLDDRGEAVAKDLGDAAVYAHLDVRSEPDWARATGLAADRFGKLDVLVNNAAVLNVASIEDHTLEEFTRVVTVNQIGPFLGIKAAIEPMRAAGGGSIVNICSIDALEGMNGVAAYASSKWGLRGLSRCAALELGRYGIRVNTVCPASGSFEMIQPFIEGKYDIEAVIKSHPTPAFTPKKDDKLREIAQVVAFLASDAASSCTGGDFPVDRGYTAGKIIKGAPGSD